MPYVFGLHLGWMECSLVALQTGSRQSVAVVADRHDRSVVGTRPVVAWTTGGALVGDVALPLLALNRQVEGEEIKAAHALYAAAGLPDAPEPMVWPLALLFRKLALDLDAAGFPADPPRQIAICAPSVRKAIVSAAMSASGLGVPCFVTRRDAARDALAERSGTVDAAGTGMGMVDLGITGAELHLWPGTQPSEGDWIAPRRRDALKTLFEAHPKNLRPDAYPTLVRAWTRPPRPHGPDVGLADILPRVNATGGSPASETPLVPEFSDYPMHAIAVAGDFATPGIHPDLDAALEPVASMFGGKSIPIVRLTGADLAHGAAKSLTDRTAAVTRLIDIQPAEPAGQNTTLPRPVDSSALTHLIGMPINEGRRL